MQTLVIIALSVSLVISLSTLLIVIYRHDHIVRNLRTEHANFLESLRPEAISFFDEQFKRRGLSSFQCGGKQIKGINDLHEIPTHFLLRTKAEWIPF